MPRGRPKKRTETTSVDQVPEKIARLNEEDGTCKEETFSFDSLPSDIKTMILRKVGECSKTMKLQKRFWNMRAVSRTFNQIMTSESFMRSFPNVRTCFHDLNITKCLARGVTARLNSQFGEIKKNLGRWKNLPDYLRSTHFKIKEIRILTHALNNPETMEVFDYLLTDYCEKDGARMYVSFKKNSKPSLETREKIEKLIAMGKIHHSIVTYGSRPGRRICYCAGFGPPRKPIEQEWAEALFSKYYR